jgi:hypothetical protein
MTDNFSGDTALLEATIALSGSAAASERLPMADAPLLDRLNSDSSSDVRRPLQSPDANQLKAAKLPAQRHVRFHSDGSACCRHSFFCWKATNRCLSAVAPCIYSLSYLNGRGSWSPSRS